MKSILLFIVCPLLLVLVAACVIAVRRAVREEPGPRDLTDAELDDVGTAHPWGRRTDEYDTQAIERAARQHKGRAPQEHERSTLPKAANDSSTEASDRPQRRRLHRV